MEILQFLSEHTGTFWPLLVLSFISMGIGWYAHDGLKRVTAIEKWIEIHVRQGEQGLERLNKLEDIVSRLDILLNQHEAELRGPHGLRDHENLLTIHAVEIENLKERQKEKS